MTLTCSGVRARTEVLLVLQRAIFTFLVNPGTSAFLPLLGD